MNSEQSLPGWNYNPSAWSQRLPIVVSAMTGFAIASYLSLYQLRVFTTVWEPFFGSGSEKILNSGVSRILPIPDAALGALGEHPPVVEVPVGGYYACAGTLPTYQTEHQDKIDTLRALKAAGLPVGQAFELVAVHWPEPTGTIYYCVTLSDTLPPGIEVL